MTGQKGQKSWQGSAAQRLRWRFVSGAGLPAVRWPRVRGCARGEVSASVPSPEGAPGVTVAGTVTPESGWLSRCFFP
jgi:hypothetical protein